LKYQVAARRVSLGGASMATFKTFKKATLKLLDSQSKAGLGLSTQQRVDSLVKLAQSFAREEVATARDRAMRVSGDALYVRGNAGLYTSEAEGKKAMQSIERLRKK
jgi:hypothetical protein